MTPRRPTQDDVAAIATVINDWIDGTPWMTRDVSAQQIEALIAQGMPMREMWVIGDPVQAYISIEAEIAHVWGFYCATPGQGLGKCLLDRAKEGRDFLSLNTHVPNVNAQRFYRREGFVPIRELDPGPVSTVNDQGPRQATALRELRMEWLR